MCTGSGIGSALSTCIQVRQRLLFYRVTPVIGLNYTLRAQTGTEFSHLLHTTPTTFLHRYLIWIGSEQAKTFGPTISGLIRRHIGRERITIWDSKYQGRDYPFCPL